MSAGTSSVARGPHLLALCKTSKLLEIIIPAIRPLWWALCMRVWVCIESKQFLVRATFVRICKLNPCRLACVAHHNEWPTRFMAFNAFISFALSATVVPLSRCKTF